MKKILLAWTLLIVACGSPLQNRTNTEDKKNMAITPLYFKNQKLFVTVQWLDGPYESPKKNNTLLVILQDENKTPMDLPRPLELTFYSTMPSMGHPMDDSGYFEHLDTGVYINKNIRFNMGGDWKHELWLLDRDFNKKDELSWLDFI